MNRSVIIALKDIRQLTRDFKTFLFMLLMPILFTFLFGFALGGFGGSQDERLPLGFVDEDNSRLSRQLQGLLANSEVVRLVESEGDSPAELEELILKNKLAAAIIVPPRYGKSFVRDRNIHLIFIAKPGTPTFTTVEAAVIATLTRLDSASRTAVILEEVTAGKIPFDYGFAQNLAGWENPPIRIIETASGVIHADAEQSSTLAHTSPGMMLQFAIAGLMTSAQILVAERKSRSLQRMRTTTTTPSQILLGHYLAIFITIFSQFVLLILFGQFILRVDYLRLPTATFLLAVCSALCISGLGLLIGVLARSEEQAIIFSLVPMFVLAGLGGAWVPLEYTGAVFQAIGHLSPVAWAMDGFKNLTIRGLGIRSVLLPCAVLLGYAAIFVALAVWRLMKSEES